MLVYESRRVNKNNFPNGYDDAIGLAAPMSTHKSTHIVSLDLLGYQGVGEIADVHTMEKHLDSPATPLKQFLIYFAGFDATNQLYSILNSTCPYDTDHIQGSTNGEEIHRLYENNEIESVANAQNGFIPSC